eukprot:6123632-Pyramimonas_sp.AAC.1
MGGLSVTPGRGPSGAGASRCRRVHEYPPPIQVTPLACLVGSSAKPMPDPITSTESAHTAHSWTAKADRSAVDTRAAW